MTPAGQTSFLIDVSPGADHTIQEEALAFPRIVRLPTFMMAGHFRVWLKAGTCSCAHEGDMQHRLIPLVLAYTCQSIP